MIKNPEPRITSGILQGLGYTAVGAGLNNGKDFLERFVLMNRELLENAPLHIAVHIIKDLDTVPPPYAQVHCHPSCDEIGLVVGPKDQLEYEIVLNGEVKRVKSPASVYIPAGTHHRARAISGSGAYVCILLDPGGPQAGNVQIME